MPAEGEETHRLQPLDVKFEREADIRLLQLRHLGVDRRRRDPPDQPGPSRELALELDAEPAAEALRFADRPPDALARHRQDDLLFYTVGNVHSATSRLHKA